MTDYYDCAEYTNNFANINRLKALFPAGEPVPSDSTLSFYLESAQEIVLNRAFPFGASSGTAKQNCLKRYANVMIRIAFALIAKQGAEGETQHSENGVSRHYDSADVPKALLEQITPYCKMVFTSSDY